MFAVGKISDVGLNGYSSQPGGKMSTALSSFLVVEGRVRAEAYLLEGPTSARRQNLY